jgi:hypothetical protein
MVVTWEVMRCQHVVLSLHRSQSIQASWCFQAVLGKILVIVQSWEYYYGRYHTIRWMLLGQEIA